MKLPLTLSLILLSSPLGAGAAEFWRFETDEGVLSFVDETKRIPEKYRERAVREESKGLASYGRSTLAGARAAVQVPEFAPPVVMPVPDGSVDKAPRHVRTKEFRWVDGAFGAPSEVYTLVEVVRDADGEIVSVELHDPDTVHVVSGR